MMQDKDLIRSIGLFFLMMVVFYLMASFVAMSLNPFTWSDFAREAYAFFGTCVATFLSAAYYQIEKD